MVTKVSDVGIGGLSRDGSTLAGTATVRTTGIGEVKLSVGYAVNGETVHTQRMTLRGATTYLRPFQHVLGKEPCGAGWSVTVTTDPASANGSQTARGDLPRCVTTVTGLRIAGITMDAAPGRALSARIAVTTTGTARVPVTAEFRTAGRTAGTRKITLSGDTSYTRTTSYTLPKRPCDSTVAVKVTAGSQTATGQTRVRCPAAVAAVNVVRATVNPDGNAAATVRVTTDNAKRVRLSVVLRVAGRNVTRTVSLAGATSYTRTIGFAVGDVACGKGWRVSATTAPPPRNGAAAYSGRTPACPKPTPKATPTSDDPSIR